VHILVFIVVGLLSLAAFVLVARLISRDVHTNGAIGVLQAGIPLLNEVAAFIPIFCVPAVAAWYLSRCRAAGEEHASREGPDGR
jgi:hypothetical protein